MQQASFRHFLEALFYFALSPFIPSSHSPFPLVPTRTHPSLPTFMFHGFSYPYHLTLKACAPPQNLLSHFLMFTHTHGSAACPSIWDSSQYSPAWILPRSEVWGTISWGASAMFWIWCYCVLNGTCFVGLSLVSGVGTLRWRLRQVPVDLAFGKNWNQSSGTISCWKRVFVKGVNMAVPCLSYAWWFDFLFSKVFIPAAIRFLPRTTEEQ